MQKTCRYVTTKEELAERLRYIRTCHELTQSTVAEYLGVSRSAYAYYETAKTTPDVFTLIRLSYYYKIEIGYFIQENNCEYKRCFKHMV